MRSPRAAQALHVTRGRTRVPCPEQKTLSDMAGAAGHGAGALESTSCGTAGRLVRLPKLAGLRVAFRGLATEKKVPRFGRHRLHQPEHTLPHGSIVRSNSLARGSGWTRGKAGLLGRLVNAPPQWRVTTPHSLECHHARSRAASRGPQRPWLNREPRLRTDSSCHNF